MIRVPDNKVGLIIGRGGSTIRSLMQESGATIDIPKGKALRAAAPTDRGTDNLTGEPYREIKVGACASGCMRDWLQVRGTADAIARCKTLVHQTITPWHEQHGRGPPPAHHPRPVEQEVRCMECDAAQ